MSECVVIGGVLGAAGRVKGGDKGALEAIVERVIEKGECVEMDVCLCKRV